MREIISGQQVLYGAISPAVLKHIWVRRYKYRRCQTCQPLETKYFQLADYLCFYKAFEYVMLAEIKRSRLRTRHLLLQLFSVFQNLKLLDTRNVFRLPSCYNIVACNPVSIRTIPWLVQKTCSSINVLSLVNLDVCKSLGTLAVWRQLRFISTKHFIN